MAGIQKENEAVRKEFLSLQLELKVAHETAWGVEEELQSLRTQVRAPVRVCVCERDMYAHTHTHTHTHTQVTAREGEAQELMGKLASKESEVVKLQAAKDEQQRQSTQLIERLHKDVALWQATVKSVAAAGAAGTVICLSCQCGCLPSARPCVCVSAGPAAAAGRAWIGCCSVWLHVRIRVSADALSV